MRLGQLGLLQHHLSHVNRIGIEALIRRGPPTISGEHPGLLHGIPPALNLPPAEQTSAQINGVGQRLEALRSGTWTDQMTFNFSELVVDDSQTCRGWLHQSLDLGLYGPLELLPLGAADDLERRSFR